MLGSVINFFNEIKTKIRMKIYHVLQYAACDIL